jgi:hypothetical protein
VATALAAEGGAFAGITPFGITSAALSPELLLGGTREAIARAKHNEYRRQQAEQGMTPETNSSMVPWDELPEELKESNRAFADGIGAKLEATHVALVPAALTDARAPEFAFTDTEVEELAKQEHERWNRYKAARGWKPTTGVQDDERKLDPLLVPWEQLPERERDKDRDPIRELPAMLAAAGFRLYRA